MKANLDTPLDENLQTAQLATVGDLVHRLSDLSISIAASKRNNEKLLLQMDEMLDAFKDQASTRKRYSDAYVHLVDRVVHLANQLLQLSSAGESVPSEEITQHVKGIVRSLKESNQIVSGESHE